MTAVCHRLEWFCDEGWRAGNSGDGVLPAKPRIVCSCFGMFASIWSIRRESLEACEGRMRLSIVTRK